MLSSDLTYLGWSSIIGRQHHSEGFEVDIFCGDLMQKAGTGQLQV